MFLHRITLVATALALAAPTGMPATESAAPATASARSIPAPHHLRPVLAEPVADTPTVAMSVVEREAVSWALNRFEEAGLELPEVAISFSTDPADCAGEQGVYRRRSGAHSVTVCVPDRPGVVIEHRRRRTLLHELAHAWDHATLDDEDRARLLERFDAQDWYGPERPWEDRGVEQLAETLTWGLLDQLRRPLLIARPCAQVHADFRAATGRPALGPIEAVCE